MPLTDLRFLQNTQELLLQFEDGSKGTVILSDLNQQAQVISGIEAISPLQIKFYFDGSEQGVVFDAAQLQGWLK